MNEYLSDDYIRALNSEWLANTNDNESHFNMYNDFFMNDIVILYAGYQNNLPNNSYGPMARDHFIYHYVVSGSVTVSFDNETTFTINAGQGFLVFPNDKASFCMSKNSPSSVLWLGFKGAAAEKLVNEAGITPSRFIIDYSFRDEAYRIMNAFIYYSHAADTLSVLRSHVLFYNMIVLWAKENTLESNEKEIKRISGKIQKKYVEKAVNYIEENYYRNIKVSDVAKYAGIDVSYFSRIFKQAFQINVIEYIQEFRLESAKKMLLNTTKSVKEVADENGFKNVSYFVKCFKKRYGCTPNTFKSMQSITVHKF